MSRAADPQLTPRADQAGRAADGPWTTRRLLAWMSGALERATVESPKLCAEMLVSNVLGCDRLKLYMDPDRPATPGELARLRDLTARALKHEPVQYLVGEAWFFSMPFAVDRRVLIPRPCTEMIVEEVLQRARAGAPAARILDMCTGSGCIAVAIAKHLPAARVTATDVSGDALEVARANAARHGVDERITFLEGETWGPLGTTGLADQRAFDFVCANPPYIPDHEWDDPSMMGRNVKGHEPDLALRGGADGLAVVRPIVERAHEFLAPGGVLLIEIAASTADAVLALARANGGLADARIMPDHERHPRVLMAKRV